MKILAQLIRTTDLVIAEKIIECLVITSNSFYEVCEDDQTKLPSENSKSYIKRFISGIEVYDEQEDAEDSNNLDANSWNKEVDNDMQDDSEENTDSQLSAWLDALYNRASAQYSMERPHIPLGYRENYHFLPRFSVSLRRLL